MEKSAEAFRSIGEVAKLVGVAPHVLRYWETQFSLLKPVKRRDGRRYYRPDDVLLAAGLCQVLREEGLTIRGAKKLLTKDRGDTVRRRGAAVLAAMDDGSATALARAAGMGAEDMVADDMAVESPAAKPAQTPQPVPTSPASVDASTPDHPPPPIDAVTGIETTDDSRSIPKSRARKRRTQPASAPLPLFPDLANAPLRAGEGGVWLARLTATAQALGGLKSGRDLPPDARAAAMRLRRAIDSIY